MGAWTPVNTWDITAQVHILLAVLSAAMLVVYLAACVIHFRRATRPQIRRKWLVWGALYLTFFCLAIVLALLVPLYASNTQTLLYQGWAFLSTVMMGMGIRLFFQTADDARQMRLRLREMNQALSAHQSGLESLVVNRTRALRKEIAERRSSELALRKAKTQLERDVSLAGEIQRALMPLIHPVRFAWATAQFRPWSEVSGDIYSFVADDDSLRILLADAMGHGVPAGLLTQAIAATAQRTRLDTPPRILLERINQTLCRATRMEFATAACIQLDQTGQLTYANAGGPSLLIWRAAEQALEEVEAPSQPIGMFTTASSEFAHASLQLAPGDRAFLYTDGLSELVLEDGTPLGVEGVREFLRSRADSPLLEIPVELDAVLLAHVPRITDDISMICLEYAPEGTD